MQAAETLGGPEAVQAMINETLHATAASRSPVTRQWVSTTAGLVLAALGAPLDLANLACPRRGATPDPRR